jgi:hypothetical protein
MKALPLISSLFATSVIMACSESAQKTAPTTLSITVENQNELAISGAAIDLYNGSNQFINHYTTNNQGMLSTELAAGSYSVRISAQGYQPSPAKGINAVPFEVLSETTTLKEFELANIISATADSQISGNVTESGMLVVAQTSDGVAASGLSLNDGSYQLFNIEPGDYQLTAFKAGYSANNISSIVVSGGENFENQDLTTNEITGNTLTGAISFLATNNGMVDVTLLHPISRDAIPGLATQSDDSINYTVSGIANGDYLAWASYDNDEYVIDPDWINKNGGERSALALNINSANSEKDFSVTGSVIISSPSNSTNNRQPAIVSSLTPTLEWTDYSSTKAWALEVTNSQGETVWGGYNITSSTINHDVIDKSATSIVYNFDNSGEALMEGETYQWKITAFNDTADSTNKEAISQSEIGLGLFTVKLP